jgi:hemerythrin-like domain-containing protein
MCLAHNTFIRSLNAIYIQATGVSSPKDISDFLVYCQCWYESVHHHHNLEETLLFPQMEEALNKPGLMTPNIEQHIAFHDAFDTWGKMCYSITPEQYDGREWRRMINEFSPAMMQHLHEEIETLEELIQYDPEMTILEPIWEKLHKQAVSETNKASLS